MSADEPLDLDAAAAVEADDALVERLRHALSPDAAVVWDDDDEDSDDLSYALLRALQRDVSTDLDPVPVAEVVPLAGRRRRFGRTATVAAVAAGVLSVAGAAAAATSSPGHALSGVRSAVSSAVHDAIDAITPPKTTSPSPAAPATTAATPTALATPPGTQVSTAARSASAVVQIEERLAVAGRLVAAGRGVAAGEVLDQAQRRLPLVTDAGRRADFQAQIDRLRSQIAALSAPRGRPTSGPAADHSRAPSHEPQSRPHSTHTPASSHRADSGAPTPTAHPGASANPGAPHVPTLPAPARSAQSR